MQVLILIMLGVIPLSHAVLSNQLTLREQNSLKQITDSLSDLRNYTESACSGTRPVLHPKKMTEAISDAVQTMAAYKADRKSVIKSGLGKILITTIVGIVVGIAALGVNVFMYCYMRARLNSCRRI